MQTLDRYLVREFAQTIFATLIVLLIVMVGGAFVDVLGDITRGRLPANRQPWVRRGTRSHTCRTACSARRR